MEFESITLEKWSKFVQISLRSMQTKKNWIWMKKNDEKIEKNRSATQV